MKTLKCFVSFLFSDQTGKVDRKLKEGQKTMEERVTQLEDEILGLSIHFREAMSCLKEQNQQLKHEKSCKDVVLMLKDFDVIQKIAMKIGKGRPTKCFSLNEKLTLKYMINKRHVGNGIQGLLASQNMYGHSRVTRSVIERCKRLAAQCDVFQHFNVKGKAEDIVDFANSTEPDLKTVEQFLRFNPNVGTNVYIKHGHGQVWFKSRSGGGPRAGPRVI